MATIDYGSDFWRKEIARSEADSALWRDGLIKAFDRKAGVPIRTGIEYDAPVIGCVQEDVEEGKVGRVMIGGEAMRDTMKGFFDEEVDKMNVAMYADGTDKESDDMARATDGHERRFRLLRVLLVNPDVDKNIDDVKKKLVFDSGEFFSDGSVEEAIAQLNLAAEVKKYNDGVLSTVFDKAIQRAHGRDVALEDVTLDDLRTIAVDLLG